MKFIVAGALGHIGSRLVREIGEWYPNSEIVMIDNLSSERYQTKLIQTRGYIKQDF